MRTVAKNKQNLTNQVKRRFHFDPKSQSTRPRAINKNKTSIHTITTQKNDGQFSSVKEKNQFNDSSWLAKLVNGIQQNSNVPNSKDSLNGITEVSEPNRKQLLYPTKKNSVNSVGVQEKKSAHPQKIYERKKSLFTTYSQNKHKSNPSISKSKINENKQLKTSKQVHQLANAIEPISHEDPLQSNQIMRNQDDKARHRQSIEKNSLISYSSIGVEDMEQELFVLKEGKNEEQVKKDNQKSYKKKIGGGNSKPKIISKDKKKTIENSIQKKQFLRKRSSQPKKKYQYEIEPKESSNGSQLQANSKKQSVGRYSKKTNDNVMNCIKSKFENNKMEEESQNQFLKKSWLLQDPTPIHSFVERKISRLDLNSREETKNGIDVKQITPKPLVFEEDKQVRKGFIRKNKTNENIATINEQKKYSPLKYNYDSRIPATNQLVTIKKARRMSGNLMHLKKNEIKDIEDVQIVDLPFQDHDHNRSLHEFNPINQREQTKAPVFDQETQKLQFMYYKLNGNNEKTIHNENCFEVNLSQQERYEVGPLISKIKYMNKSYSEQQFIKQCRRINLEVSHCSKRAVTTIQENSKNGKVTKNYKKEIEGVSSRPNKDIYQLRKMETKEVNTKKYSYFDYDKENRNIQTDIKERDKCFSKRSDSYTSQQKVIKQRSFSPLFPENRRFQDNSQKTTPNKSPYLEMPSFPHIDRQLRDFNENRSLKNATVRNIGDMIDNLNTKINSYIESNHLEDTFRKFKLDFVHLRQNMYS